MTFEKSTQKNNEHEAEKLALEKLKSEFSHIVPDEYITLAKTADIAPTAPTCGYSFPDIISDEKLFEPLDTERVESIDLPDNALTSMGKFLRDKIKQTTLMDLGCGDQKFVRNIAHSFEASRYIGVDTAVAESISQNDEFMAYTLNGDMLLFVSSLPDDFGSFFISGIEDYSGETVQTVYGDKVDLHIEPSDYMHALLKEVYRATKPGSVVIFGANNTFPDPETVGFKRIKSVEANDSSTIVYIK